MVFEYFDTDGIARRVYACHSHKTLCTIIETCLVIVS